jgi:hypothetical protein
MDWAIAIFKMELPAWQWVLVSVASGVIVDIGKAVYQAWRECA